MPRRKVFDKKTATTFALLHRAQNDPLINDENAPSMVFAEKQARRPTEDDYAYSSAGSVVSSSSRSKKTRQRGDLEEEFGFSFKPNEGEAAQHGVFFDDTEYDYMQHMRDLGSGQGAVTWVEASTPAPKGKGKQRLEDALRDMDLGGERSVAGESTASSVARSLLPEEVLPSEFVRRRTYQDQQDVPDEIAGFQPDMDPRLREVLEALEDEEYVDDEEDVFAELTRDAYEVQRDEWERLGEQQTFEDGDAELDDEGWESDHTLRAASPPPPISPQVSEGEIAAPPEDVQAEPPADPTAGAWQDEFAKFKQNSKAGRPTTRDIAPLVAPSALESSALSSLASGRRKKRKGAKTSTTNYSMTSSALARTDQQTLLDARFDRVLENEDMLDEIAEEASLPDTTSLASGMTGMSKASAVSRYSNLSRQSGASGMSRMSSYSRATDSEAPQLIRADFDRMMDDFLGGYGKVGKAGGRVKRGGQQSGMEQLEEIRKGLGPARVRTKVAGAS
ncbi:hypothetical protein BAUCODRAFT_32847 [Baudoinia panamericana UAMH 10762]|uniref:Low temperature viability protein n=1 Tax=Baudoinia panamericana (strain UAMH 10762) TaxID=717646 RepID=M2MZP8_BAUPA|nr:uncharacterized protein BAUCODRAFT_32847 [Baudoinia panamericana UAMH 10762]EMC97103.1 hypothetical protein BAUCODRAFT_32847 [Baudoinia panamericana UAMH 10762]